MQHFLTARDAASVTAVSETADGVADVATDGTTVGAADAVTTAAEIADGVAAAAVVTPAAAGTTAIVIATHAAARDVIDSIVLAVGNSSENEALT